MTVVGRPELLAIELDERLLLAASRPSLTFRIGHLNDRFGLERTLALKYGAA